MTALALMFFLAGAALIWDILGPLLDSIARDHTINILAGLVIIGALAHRYLDHLDPDHPRPALGDRP